MSAARVVAIAGSLRRGSLNAALLRACEEFVPSGDSLEPASIAGIPLYDQDLEDQQGIPEAAAALKDRIAGADGLLIATPEYNNGVPGVLKNAVDWLTRPPADIPRVWGGKPVGIIGATPGPNGTRLAQAAWLQTFRVLGAQVWFGRSLFVARAREAFDERGALIDAELRERLATYVTEFYDFVGRGHP